MRQPNGEEDDPNGRLPVRKRDLLRATGAAALGGFAGCLGTVERTYEATPVGLSGERAREHGFAAEPVVERHTATPSKDLGVASVDAEVTAYTYRYEYAGDDESGSAPSPTADDTAATPSGDTATAGTPTVTSSGAGGGSDDDSDDDGGSDTTPTGGTDGTGGPGAQTTPAGRTPTRTAADTPPAGGGDSGGERREYLAVNVVPNPSLAGQSLNPAAGQSVENLIGTRTGLVQQACDCTIGNPEQVAVESTSNPGETQYRPDDVGTRVVTWDGSNWPSGSLPGTTNVLGASTPVSYFAFAGPTSGEGARPTFLATAKTTTEVEGSPAAVIATYVVENPPIAFDAPRPLLAASITEGMEALFSTGEVTTAAERFAGVCPDLVPTGTTVTGTPTPTSTGTATETPPVGFSPEGCAVAESGSHQQKLYGSHPGGIRKNSGCPRAPTNCAYVGQDTEIRVERTKWDCGPWRSGGWGSKQEIDECIVGVRARNWSKTCTREITKTKVHICHYSGPGCSTPVGPYGLHVMGANEDEIWERTTTQTKTFNDTEYDVDPVLPRSEFQCEFRPSDMPFSLIESAPIQVTAFPMERRDGQGTETERPVPPQSLTVDGTTYDPGDTLTLDSGTHSFGFNAQTPGGFRVTGTFDVVPAAEILDVSVRRLDPPMLQVAVVRLRNNTTAEQLVDLGVDRVSGDECFIPEIEGTPFRTVSSGGTIEVNVGLRLLRTFEDRADLNEAGATFQFTADLGPGVNEKPRRDSIRFDTKPISAEAVLE